MSRRTIWVPLASVVGCLFASPVAMAGQLSVQGNVTLLDDVDQLQIVVGTADWNAGPEIPANFYADQGMTLHEGPFDAILPGVMEVGMGVLPFALDLMGVYFPGPIAGGGVAGGGSNIFGGVATFSDPITQFGAVGSTEGPQYITVWDQNGVMLGQVSWVPNADSAFFGVDTNGVPIGMITYGGDDVWGGVPYDVNDDQQIIVSDTWMWALAIACNSEIDCPDDADICTDQVCADGFCDYPFNVAPCDDGDACTEQDACSDGECVTVDVQCEDNNLCSVDSCDSQIGCVYEFIDGCCLDDEDCPEGEICLLGSNSCIPDDGGDGDGDGDGDTGDGDGDPGDGDGDTGDGDTGDGDGDTGDGDGDGGSSDDSGSEGTSGDSSGATGDPSGCSCASEPGRGALLGLLTLFMLGTVRPRRRSEG
jgi:MYXO-CTERM domain-containing protein